MDLLGHIDALLAALLPSDAGGGGCGCAAANDAGELRARVRAGLQEAGGKRAGRAGRRAVAWRRASGGGRGAEMAGWNGADPYSGVPRSRAARATAAAAVAAAGSHQIDGSKVRLRGRRRSQRIGKGKRVGMKSKWDSTG